MRRSPALFWSGVTRARKDNSSGAWKARIRLDVARMLPADAVVFEGYAGTGFLWRACWAGFRGWAVDKDAARCAAAAIERPRWAVLQGDTPSLLEAGVGRRVPFAVVDLDTWGEPWSALKAWFLSDRKRAARTHLFLTDGYRSRASIATLCKTIWPDVEGRLNLSTNAYRETVTARVWGWCLEAGLTVASWRGHTCGKMDVHHLVVAAGAGQSSAI